MKKYAQITVLMIMITLLIFTTGCSQVNQQLDKELAFTADDTKIYMDEMMYHIMLAEMQGELYASYLKSDNYWDTKNESGDKISEITKETVMDDAVRYELFYQLAIKNNYSLTQDEKEECIEKVDNILTNVSKDQINATKLTREKLNEIQEKISLSTKYYNDFKKSTGIDEESIKKKFNPEDYKQYDIEYFFSSFRKCDENGIAVLMNDDEKQQAYKEISAYAEDAKTSSDFTELVNSLTDIEKKSINTGKASFIAKENFFKGEQELEDKICSMSVGEVSDIIETQEGFYIVKLKDDSSTEKFDAAVKEKLSEIEKETIENLKKQHKIKINKLVWDKVELGKMTINTTN